MEEKTPSAGPLYHAKAIAKFVENSIDARARNITIARGREHGEHFLMLADDGEGFLIKVA